MVTEATADAPVFGDAAVVVGDLHLTRDSPTSVGEDLERLFKQHATAHVVLAGDFFDLSSDAPVSEHDRAVGEILTAQPAARRAIGEHLCRNGTVTFLGGNHDANLGQPSLLPQLYDALELPSEARSRLRTMPWFVRAGGLHIEHGHFYDPDNSPAHPLIHGAPSLGVHFSSEFIRPTGAHRYLQANDQTPLELFLAAFTWYGRRAPYVIYRYFRAAFQALAQAGPFYQRDNERTAGFEAHALYAERAGVSANVIDQLVTLGAPSTLESLSATFARLYLDRVVATLALGTGIAGLVSGRPKLGLASASVGSMLMTLSWLSGHNRYRGSVVEHLSRAAAQIRESTKAALVIFGHTHLETDTEGYANTGSFAFPGDSPGRPYLQVDLSRSQPRATRRHLPVV